MTLTMVSRALHQGSGPQLWSACTLSNFVLEIGYHIRVVGHLSCTVVHATITGGRGTPQALAVHHLDWKKKL